jgi:hypothetical protein
MKRNTMDPQTYSYWRAFQEQRSGAKKRGIEWQLTWEEWLQWWQRTGCLDKRGKNKGQYVMCRFGDTGPYALDNIYCDLTDNNSSLPGKRQRGIAKHYAVHNKDKGTRIVINGVEYPGMAYASRALGISRTTIRWRINHGTPGYELL